jgi:hypothetical protein
MKALRHGDIEGCGECHYYGQCGGDRTAAFAATGSFLKKDPACWIDSLTKEAYPYEPKIKTRDSYHSDFDSLPRH